MLYDVRLQLDDVNQEVIATIVGQLQGLCNVFTLFPAELYHCVDWIGPFAIYVTLMPCIFDQGSCGGCWALCRRDGSKNV